MTFIARQFVKANAKQAANASFEERAEAAAGREGTLDRQGRQPSTAPNSATPEEEGEEERGEKGERERDGDIREIEEEKETDIFSRSNGQQHGTYIQ